VAPQRAVFNYLELYGYINLMAKELKVQAQNLKYKAKVALNIKFLFI